MIRLIWLVLLVIGILALRNMVRSKPPAPAPKAGNSPEAMLCCAHCGVHFPASEAVHEQDRVYCSEQHHQQSLR